MRLSGLVRGLAEKLRFVPPHATLSPHDLRTLADFLSSSRRLFVITGAGVSTESGIKDYRSKGVGLYATTSHRPTIYADFLRSDDVRRRYWARNATAWSVFSAFQPNASHAFLASHEHRGRLHWLVTQNVDCLHHKAGSRRLTELHGTVFSVICLDCKRMTSREEIQLQIFTENPDWTAKPEGFAPDADVFIAEESVRRFKTPHCHYCGGVLKPDVVFFGDTVPRQRVDHINERLEEADAMMVAGSSLQTYSSYRHIHRGKEMGLPLLILNIGPTRADEVADVKIAGRVGEAFSWLLAGDHVM